MEKDTQTKLDTLFRKNLYQVAIDMAYSNQYDPAAIVDIFREYGDHLYEYLLLYSLMLVVLLTISIVVRATLMAPSNNISRPLERKVSIATSSFLLALCLTYPCSISGQFGALEPSYVIKQFLDAQRIHNLTFYLEKLHEAGVANANHTTLLLNCYTKLKDVDKLNEFIKVWETAI